MTRAELLRWAQAEAGAWLEKRHDLERETLADFVARIYLQGQIDALKEHTAYLVEERRKYDAARRTDRNAQG